MYSRGQVRRTSHQRGREARSLFNDQGSIDSSVDLQEASSGESEDSRCIRGRNSRRTVEECISHSSSNVSSGSEYSRDFERNLSMNTDDSGNEDDGLEGFLQMGCMDSFFLPGGEKPKAKKSIVTVNKNGKRELNLNIKGPLALGYEAQLMQNDENGTPKIKMSFSTMSCNTPSMMGRYEETSVLDDTREIESTQFRSLMSLSHESSVENDDHFGGDNFDDNLNITGGNFRLPPQVPQFQLQSPRDQKHWNHHQQQKNCTALDYSHQQNPYALQQSHPEENHDNQARNRTDLPFTGGMPYQIIVQNRHAYEDESCLTYENAIAPDPPQTALPQIPEEDYSCSSTEAASDELVDEKVVVKEPSMNQGRLSKAERWRKANAKRLRPNKVSVAEENVAQNNTGGESVVVDSEDDLSVESDQATHSSISLNRSSSEDLQKKSSDFDSIFSRRIQKRRAAKLRYSSSSESSFDQNSDSNSMKDSRKMQSRSKQKSSSRKQDKTFRNSSNEEFQPRVRTITVNDNEMDSQFDSASVIQAVAAAAAAVLARESPSVGCDSFDNEDTENQAPPNVIGHKTKEVANRPISNYPKIKNPFQDDDLFNEDDDDDDNDDSDVHEYPLLASSSSDDLDEFRPMWEEQDPPSLARSINRESPRMSSRGVPMSPSPRHASGAASVLSPRLYGGANQAPKSRNQHQKEQGMMEDLANRVAIATIGKSPRVISRNSPRGHLLSPRGGQMMSPKGSFHSVRSNGTESMFFEAEMYES